MEGGTLRRGSEVRRTIKRGLLSLVAGLVLVGIAAAQDGQRVSNVFYDTDLRQALQDVAAQAGVNIIVGPSVGGLVTVELEEVTVPEALDLLLAGTEYQVERTEDYYLVYTADESSDMFPRVAETELFRVRNVDAETARDMLPDPLQRSVRVNAENNTLAVTAPDDILGRIERDLADIDRPVREDSVYLGLNHLPPETARNLLPNSLQRFVRADPDGNRLAVTAPSGALDRIRRHLSEIDVPRGPAAYEVPDVFRTEVVKLNHSSAEAVLALLPSSLQDYVRADEESSTLAITVPPSMLPGVLSDIRAIDVPRQHVMLDARVVVLERADLLDFGGEWTWPTLTAGTVDTDAVTWPWELRIGYSPDREFTEALSLTINLLSANEEATVIASPQVMAQDGREAEIRVTTVEYFQIVSEFDTFLRADLEEIETGTILRITPRVGPNGKLTLDMNIEVSDVIARGEQNLPVVSRRIARSTVQIESGGTAAIAGLVDTRSQVGQSGVPAVRNIPLLGQAFRTDTLNHRARQVAVFVTATVVGETHRQFATGRPDVPAAVARVDEAEYRQELEAALDRLGAGN